MQKIQKAAFSIVNYKFDKVIIDLSNYTPENLDLSIDPHGIFNNEDKTYELSYLVMILNSDENTTFVELRCVGIFKFENVSSIEDIPDFFYRNCMAILFPYVRAYISLVTTQANVPGIILPTMNLTGLEIELKKNTTQK